MTSATKSQTLLGYPVVVSNEAPRANISEIRFGLSEMTETKPESRTLITATCIGDFTIDAVAYSHYCEFTCYRCHGMTADTGGDYTVPVYQKKDADFQLDPVERLEEAEVFVQGSIKWDGCANLNMAPDEDGYFHFCSRDDASKVGELLDRLYDLAKELIPVWDGSIAE